MLVGLVLLVVKVLRLGEGCVDRAYDVGNCWCNSVGTSKTKTANTAPQQWKKTGANARSANEGTLV